MPELRKVHRVQLDVAHIVGNQRNHADEGRAAVVGPAVEEGKSAAYLPALAEFELIAQRRELRPVVPRITVRADLGKGGAARIIGQFVVKTESGIDFIIQSQALGGLAVGMIGEPVDVEFERFEIESVIGRPDFMRRFNAFVGKRGAAPAQTQGNRESQQPRIEISHLPLACRASAADGANFEGQALCLRGGREYVPSRRRPQCGILSVRQRTQAGNILAAMRVLAPGSPDRMRE
jgi:hypothetical protein